MALHEYCEKHVSGTKDKLKVSLVVENSTASTSSDGSGTQKKAAAESGKPAKPKRSHKKKVAPPATATAPAVSAAVERSPPVKPRSAPALVPSHFDLMRSEAERAAAAALEQEEVLEPLMFGDEQAPIEGLGEGGLFGIADVPMFGGP